MKETWQPALGYESKYEVSDAGNVRSLRRNIILKPYPTGTRGDLKVDFGGNPRKTYYVARLVLLAFDGLNKHRTEANHKDGNITNNRKTNLEWVTHRENKLHSYRVLKRGLSKPGLRGTRNPNAKLTDALVRKYRILHLGGAGVREITRMSRIDRRSIQMMLRRKTWVHVD